MAKITHHQQFPVIPPDYDHEIEWFDTIEQAQLYAAATGGAVYEDSGLAATMWQMARESLAHIRQMILDNTKP